MVVVVVVVVVVPLAHLRSLLQDQERAEEPGSDRDPHGQQPASADGLVPNHHGAASLAAVAPRGQGVGMDASSTLMCLQSHGFSVDLNIGLLGIRQDLGRHRPRNTRVPNAGWVGGWVPRFNASCEPPRC